jgi:DNA-binding transcriptional LysR family regulator
VNDKDWEIIKILHEERSITRAANRMYLSQPALTYRLDQIEKEMDTQLFMRSTKGVNFTSAGERLVTYAEKMLREYFDMKRFVKSHEGQISGMLRLGSSAVFAHNQLPSLLKEFFQKYPAVETNLYAGLSNDILEQLQKERIAVAIIRGDHPWKEADILLQEEPLCLISANPVSIEKLPSIPGISYRTDPTMQYQIDRWWQENFSVPPKILMLADSVYTCRQLVLAGLGWAILPSLRLPEQRDQLFVKELTNKQNEPYKRQTRLIFRHIAQEIDAVNIFIQFICAKFSVQQKCANQS